MKIWSYSQSHRIDGEGELVQKANRYFEAGEVHGLSPDTIRSYAFTLMAFFIWLESDWKTFENLDQKKLQDWMTHLKGVALKPRSTNQMLVCVRGFYRFTFGKPIPHAAGVLYPRPHYRGPRKNERGDPYTRRRIGLELKVKVPHEVTDPIRPGEIDQLLRHLNRYRDIAVTLTMLLCGLRSQEVILLRMEDINFHQSALRVRGKGKRERIVPLPFQLMQVYEKYLTVERPETSSNHFFVVLQGKRFGESLNRHTFRAFYWYYRKKLGLKKARPHQFRHAFASDMARAGVPLTTIQKLLGHSDPKTSLIYIELFFEDIRDEYEKAIQRIGERYAAFSK